MRDLEDQEAVDGIIQDAIFRLQDLNFSQSDYLKGLERMAGKLEFEIDEAEEDLEKIDEEAGYERPIDAEYEGL